MLPWFSDKKSSDKDPWPPADIESHPDIKLYKLIELSEHHHVQILALKNQHYLLEKKRHKKLPLQHITDKKMLQLIKNNKLTRQGLLDYLRQHPSPDPNEPKPSRPAGKNRAEASRKPKVDYLIDEDEEPARPHLPPPKQLFSKLQGAMAEFAENNPDTADVLNLNVSNANAPFQAYFDSVPAGGGGNKIKTQALPPPALRDESVEAFMPSKSPSTRSAVSHSLEKVIQRQRERLVEVQMMKQKVENEKKKLDAALERKKYLEAQIIDIEQRIERFQQDFFRMQLTEEDLLRKTAFDLEKIQQELNQILTDGSVLKAVLDENAQFTNQLANGPFKHLENLIHSLNLVVQQRRMVNHLLQQREHALLEQQRIKVLIKRKEELEAGIEELQQIIFQIDQTNQNMMAMDPYCVPEPVPVPALNELARLEFELQNILGDPGVQQELNQHQRTTPRHF